MIAKKRARPEKRKVEFLNLLLPKNSRNSKINESKTSEIGKWTTIG